MSRSLSRRLVLVASTFAIATLAACASPTGPASNGDDGTGETSVDSTARGGVYGGSSTKMCGGVYGGSSTC